MITSEDFVEKFLQALVKIGACSQQEGKAYVKAFHDNAKSQFTYFLIEEGLITREQALNALSMLYKVPAFDVVGYFFLRHELQKFPKGVLLRNAMIPLVREENILTMVASRPDNPELLNIIGQSVSYSIEFMVGIEQDITDAIKEFYDESDQEVDEDEDRNEEEREQEIARRILYQDEE